MTPLLRPITTSDKLTFYNLIQFYLYDFSPYLDFDLLPSGKYETPSIDLILIDPHYIAFFVIVEEKIAGFALIRRNAQENTLSDHTLEEFFIIKKYRRQGIGKQIAVKIFNKYPGRWSVSQLINNLPAQAFWRNVIGQYTKQQYNEKIEVDRITQVFYN